MPAKHLKSHRKFYGRSRELKSTRRMSRAAGLPPGSLIHIGELRTTRTDITVMSYNEQTFTERQIEDISQFHCDREDDLVHWINIDGLHDVEVVRTIGECFDIHPLVLEDILNTNQRPKLEDYERYLYIVFKMLYPNGNHHGEGNGNGGGNGNGNGEPEVISEQVSLIVGRNYVISFQEKPGDVFDVIRDRIRHLKGRVRRAGADYLAYALMDAVVDNYFIILERMGETIEDGEEQIIASPTMETLSRIHCLRGEMFGLRRSVWPLREVVGALERGDLALVRHDTVPYLRDLYDHTIQVIDTIETYRDIIAGMMDIYLSSASNRLNEVMKVLTMISTIFIPLSFIVGLYGMNFEFMPELHKKWGYPMVWVVMLSVSGGMVWYFKRKKWL